MNRDFVFVISVFAFLGCFQPVFADAPVRACDTYIAQFCTSGGDKGPGCLKGHESDVSAACLKDMQHGGPGGGGRPSGPPPSGYGEGHDSGTGQTQSGSGD